MDYSVGCGSSSSSSSRSSSSPSHSTFKYISSSYVSFYSSSSSSSSKSSSSPSHSTFKYISSSYLSFSSSSFSSSSRSTDGEGLTLVFGSSPTFSSSECSVADFAWSSTSEGVVFAWPSFESSYITGTSPSLSPSRHGKMRKPANHVCVNFFKSV